MGRNFLIYICTVEKNPTNWVSGFMQMLEDFCENMSRSNNLLTTPWVSH